MPEDIATPLPASIDGSPTELWESLFETDPNYAKDFQRTGGFKGTAIDPIWRCKRLTEVLGPCGIGWGFDVVDDKIVGSEQPIHYVRISFWYRWGEETGRFDSFGCTPVLMKRRDGFMPDEEFAKKSLTDALMTAAVRIGMSADVYLGEFDGDKYSQGEGPAPRRNGATQQSRGGSSAPRQPPRPPTAGKQGKGGSDSECPRCGTAGITPRNFDANSNRPDLECPGFDGGPPCMGREKNNGGHWPLGWYSWPKGSGPNNPPPSHQQSQAAIDAQRPLEGPPVDAYDNDAFAGNPRGDGAEDGTEGW